MRPLAFAALLLTAAVTARGQTRGAVDWIFLVDTSKSMLKNQVFAEVQRSLETFVSESAAGDSVAIFTFDRDVAFRTSTTVGRNRNDLLKIVGDLKATGDRTHLGAAIAAGLDRVTNDGDRTSAVVLFTDGKEDVRGIAGAIPIPSNIQRALSSKAHVFFVSMGEHEQQLRDFPNAQFIEANDADAIRKVAAEIRKIVKLPEPAVITVSPSELSFGDVERGATSEERELVITPDKAAPPVSIALTPIAGVTMPPHTVTPPARVKLRLTIAENAEPGQRSLRIVAAGKPINATVTVLKPPLWRAAAPWAAALIAVIVLALASKAFLKQRNLLEGELEIVKPRAAADTAYVGLPSLKSDEIALSTILPLDALAGSDARLFCRHKDGSKKVWIAATAGSLRVNDIEVPTTELFDADTIQIGDAKLRFNRVGYDRPQEDFA